MELLIVDDEAIAIQGISMVLNWGELDIETVWTATTIQEAKDIIKEENVSIILCDIEMRSENGLHLVEWVNQNYPEIQCIIVTGHVNFEYTRKVLELQVVDYLDKPLDSRKLKNAIEKAIRQREEQRVTKEVQRQNQTSVERHFFHTLLREDENRTRETIRQEITQRRISMPIDSQYCMLYLKFRKWNEEYTGEDKERVSFNIGNSLMKEYLKKTHTYARKMNQDAVVVCFVPDYKERYVEDLKEDLRQLIAYCSTYYLCKICIYIKKEVYIEQFCSAAEELRLYDEQNIVYDEGVHVVEEKQNTRFEVVLPDFEIWKALLENNAYPDLKEAIQSYMGKKSFTKFVTPKSLEQIIRDFEYMLLSVQNEGREILRGGEENLVNLRNEAGKSVEHCKDWMLACLDAMEQKQCKTLKKKSPVTILCEYIEAHLEEEISRNTLAGLVYMSPDHMTRIFKKATGMTISDYILDRKMVKAEKMLSETDLSVSYIASSLGYSNISHFSGAFKKKYQLSPSEYRQGERKMSD